MLTLSFSDPVLFSLYLTVSDESRESETSFGIVVTPSTARILYQDPSLTQDLFDSSEEIQSENKTIRLPRTPRQPFVTIERNELSLSEHAYP